MSPNQKKIMHIPVLSTDNTGSTSSTWYYPYSDESIKEIIDRSKKRLAMINMSEKKSSHLLGIDNSTPPYLLLKVNEKVIAALEELLELRQMKAKLEETNAIYFSETTVEQLAKEKQVVVKDFLTNHAKLKDVFHFSVFTDKLKLPLFPEPVVLNTLPKYPYWMAITGKEYEWLVYGEDYQIEDDGLDDLESLYKVNGSYEMLKFPLGVNLLCDNYIPILFDKSWLRSSGKDDSIHIIFSDFPEKLFFIRRELCEKFTYSNLKLDNKVVSLTYYPNVAIKDDMKVVSTLKKKGTKPKPVVDDNDDNDDDY